MSLKTLEMEIVRELRTVTGNKKLKASHIQEWATTPVKAQGEEKLAHCPEMGVYVSYLEPAKK